MKKRNIIISILTAASLLVFAFKVGDKTERTYTITIPEHLANAAYQIFNGAGDQLTVKDFKEVSQLVNTQFLTQAQQFHVQDSIANAKNKPDTTKHK